MEPRDRRSGYNPIFPSNAARLALLAGSWAMFGLFMAVQASYLSGRSGGSVQWSESLLTEMTYAFAWMLLTPIILRLAWKFPIEPPHRITRTSLHILFSLVVALTHRALFQILIQLVMPRPDNPFSWMRVEHGMFAFLDYGLMIYWGLLLVRHAYEFFRRYHQNELEKSHLEVQLMHAQLQAVKMQLQPHFLFNTLNAISVLIQKNPAAARTMIGKLSELLRLTLETHSTQEICLRAELEILDCYLHIEQTRFEDRLRVERHIGHDALDALVPTLVLQPIVENAMRHGVARQRGAAHVGIIAEKVNGSLILKVSDNGPGIDLTVPLKEGIGLSTTRQRLHQLYGDASRMELRNAQSQGLVVTMTIPFHTISSSPS